VNDHRSIETNDLFSAISKAQADIKVAVRDANNPFFKSKYANLQMVMEASRPALCKNGLMVVQQIISENDRNYLVTTLGHASGQWISSKVLLMPAKQDVQSLGSYITYMRRYCYSALVGVYDGEDDDGEGAVRENVRPLVLASNHQVAALVSYVINNKPLRDAIYKQYNVKTLEELKEEDAAKLINQLSK
jgi:ERF superfamily